MCPLNLPTSSQIVKELDLMTRDAYLKRTKRPKYWSNSCSLTDGLKKKVEEN